jgi:hypothetical protein
VTRRQSILLYAFSAWTIWIWTTRIWNIWGDDEQSSGFKAVHTVLALVSVALAIMAVVVVRRVRATASRATASRATASRDA